jgi:chloramphenicol 3-O phosphotransferase
VNSRARIVLLNGVGSVGKTAIAKALQTVTRVPFLHVQMDAFLEMLPATYDNHPDGFVFETYQEAGKPVVAITAGPVGARAMRGMRHAVAAMAGQGNNMIVDDVMLGEEGAEYAELLGPFDLMCVGVFAPLDVIERREAARGDRMLGLARWQFDRVHRNAAYDFEVDTSKATPIECALSIKDRFDL